MIAPPRATTGSWHVDRNTIVQARREGRRIDRSNDPAVLDREDFGPREAVIGDGHVTSNPHLHRATLSYPAPQRRE
jgi:hypothetical protein